MKLKTKYLLFLSLSLLSSLIIFIVLTMNFYSKDKINFIKANSSKQTMDLAKKISGWIYARGPSVVTTDEVKSYFEKDDVADLFLINKEGLVLVADKNNILKALPDIVSAGALKIINRSELSSGLLETTDTQGHEILMTYANVPGTEYFVLQTYQTKQLQRVLYLFFIKIVFAFLVIGSIFVLIGLIASEELTRGLERLKVATQKYADGDFTFRIPIISQDDFSGLAAHFNKMAERIYLNLKMEQEKLRIKGELSNAKMIQDTLFLKEPYQKGAVQITGFYESATECGGDWWYYFEKDGYVWACIGDITGHGIAAAMLTSSVRAAFCFLEKEASLTPAQVLNKLNSILLDTTKGRLQMTFFILQFSPQTGVLRYANASHEFPVFFAEGKSELNKQDLGILTHASGPHLGRDSSTQYENYEITLPRGTCILLFTDGVYDVKNDSGQAYGERKFLSSIVKSSPFANESAAFLGHIVKDVQAYRGKANLIDDISLLCLHYKKS